MPEGIVLKLKDTSIGVGSSRDGDIDVNKRISVLLPLNFSMEILGINSFKTAAMYTKFK